MLPVIQLTCSIRLVKRLHCYMNSCKGEQTLPSMFRLSPLYIKWPMMNVRDSETLSLIATIRIYSNIFNLFSQ